MTKLTASSLVLLGSASYGMLSTITKLAYQGGFSPAQVVGSQMFFGALGFWLSSFCCWKASWQLSFRSILQLLLTGSLSGLTGIFYYLSLQTLPASYAVILLFQFTWIGLGLEWLFANRRPTQRKVLAAIVIAVGTFPAAGLSIYSISPLLPIPGLVLGLLAAVSYALFIHLNANNSVQAPIMICNNWMVTGALLIAFIVFPPQFLFDNSLSSGLWMYGGFLGLFGIIIPFYLFAKGTPHIGTGSSAVLGAVELPVVIACSLLFLDEQISLHQATGIAIILFGIWLSSRQFKTGL